jgi:hypothetical protein
MRGRACAGLIGFVVLLSAGVSQGENAGRIAPLDGTQSLRERDPLLPRDAQVPPRAGPQGDSPARATTRFGEPLPPNQLTPPPVLPFHPNGSLMPSQPLMPAAPPLHPPNPAR